MHSNKIPLVGWKAVPSCWYCADQCSDEVKVLELLALGSELCPPLVLCDRVSKPFSLSPGKESEVWQSSALSERSSPLSFKLLQMFGESGHGAGRGRDSWLTGRRVLNLPSTTPCCILSVCFPSFCRASSKLTNTQSTQTARVWWTFPKTDLREFGCENIWAF